MPKKRRYSPEDLQFIRDNWENMSDEEIANELGVKAGGVKNARKNMKLVRFESRVWTDKDDETLRRYYPSSHIEEIEQRLAGRTRSSIYNRADILGVKKDPDYLLAQNRELGHKLSHSPQAKRNQFKPGQRSFNKGMKQTEFMSAGAIERTKKTRFKKGHRPKNTLWDGAIRCRRDKHGNPYMFIRISQGKWQVLHRYNWVKKHGEIPDGHLLRCIDGNTMNCHPGNWELITRAEHANRNVDMEKAVQALKDYQQAYGHPAKDLHDSYIAGLIAAGDDDMKQYLMKHRQDLIRLTRKRFQLNRKIKQIENVNE